MNADPCYRRIRMAANNERGQSMVEFALVIPILLLLTFGIMEFGRGVYTYAVLSNAAREGARYAMIHPTDCTAIKNQAVDAAFGVTLSVEDVTVTPACPISSGASVSVEIVYNFQTAVSLVSSGWTLTASSTLFVE